MPNISTKWKVPTPAAGETFDPPSDFRTAVQGIEDAAAGAAQLVADATARDVIPTAQKYPGKRVRLLSDNSEYDWVGGAWVPTTGDTGWVDLVLATGYKSYTSPPAGIRRIGSTVFVRGLITPTSGNMPASVAGVTTIPAGFRIGSTDNFPTATNVVTVTGFKQFLASGGVNINLSGTTALYASIGQTYALG